MRGFGGNPGKGKLYKVTSHMCFLLLCLSLHAQYQQDLVVLQDKLRISNKKLEEYETRFKCQEETTQKLVLEYQARLEESEERLRRQQEDKEIQMKGIISRYREMGVLGMAVRQGSLSGIRADPCSGESGFFGGAGRFHIRVFPSMLPGARKTPTPS